MNLDHGITKGSLKSIPRVSGDEPNLVNRVERLERYSPRERG